MKAAIEGLKTFPSPAGLPQGDEEIRSALRSSQIIAVKCFALGPQGTNISQACEQWVKKTGICHKSEIELGETPEACLEMAQTIAGKDEIGIFWTCAVYYDLYKLFFENPDTLPFFIQHTMLLDEMQLSATNEMAKSIENEIPIWWSIASHPSPAPLALRQTTKVNSNSQAALLCANGEVEACITTESARKIHGLTKLHSFGSPPMIFFGGITAHGADVMRRVWASVKKCASTDQYGGLTEATHLIGVSAA